MAHRITKLGKINFVVADLDESVGSWRDMFGAKELRRRGNTTIGRTGEDQAEFGGANIDLGGLVIAAGRERRERRERRGGRMNLYPPSVTTLAATERHRLDGALGAQT